MIRAAQEWLSLPENDQAQRDYFDRWLYDDLGYQRPPQPAGGLGRSCGVVSSATFFAGRSDRAGARFADCTACSAGQALPPRADRRGLRATLELSGWGW